MIRMDLEKLLLSLCEIEDRGSHGDKPVLGYLHDLIVLSTLKETTPDVMEVDFDAFTMADLKEYHETAIDAVENIFPKIEQLVKDMESIKAFQAFSTAYF